MVMTIHVPDTLNAVTAENYHVSIRLCPDGLSFSGYTPDDKGSFFTETVTLKRDVPMIQSLKDIFFNSPCMSYVYRSLYVINVSEKYTIAPEGLFSGKEKDELFSFCFQEEKGVKVLVQPLTAIHAFLIYAMDSEVYEFLMRSLVNPVFMHFLSKLLLAWHKKSLTCYQKQLYVMLHPSFFDLVCFERGELLFLNAFHHKTDADIIYSLMYVCRQIGMNQLEDQLYFCGDQKKSQSVMTTIENYIRHTCYLPLQIDKYSLGVSPSLLMDEENLKK